jgi:hypothetical protein
MPVFILYVTITENKKVLQLTIVVIAIVLLLAACGAKSEPP